MRLLLHRTSREPERASSSKVINTMNNTMNDREGLTRWLTACRHDVAHLNGISDADTKAWAEANLAEALTRFNATLQVRMESGMSDETGEDGLTPMEAALAAVKLWAQTGLRTSR